MKYLFSTALTVLFLSFHGIAQTAAPAAPDPNAPKIEFETEVIDYGTIQQYADGVRHFRIKNGGKSDLVIASATGSCGCTVAKKPEAPIKPGQTADMEVKYATERIGQFQKTVTVVSNGDRNSVVLTIKGNVLKKEGDAAAPVPGATPQTTPIAKPNK